MRRVPVRIVPAGFIYYWILEYLQANLPKAYPVEIRIQHNPLKIPNFVYTKNSQIMSEAFLNYLRAVDNWPRDERILAVVEGDARSTGTNFVFGQAEVGGRLGAVYIVRLNPEFYGSGENDGLFLLRILKEASHELGHILGLGHCSNLRCVMSFSNSVWEVDRKSWLPCEDCRGRLLSLDAQAPAEGV
ncbi:MAG: archaemetzincin [Candidatus Korarchaeum sp.]